MSAANLTSCRIEMSNVQAIVLTGGGSTTQQLRTAVINSTGLGTNNTVVDIKSSRFANLTALIAAAAPTTADMVNHPSLMLSLHCTDAPSNWCDGSSSDCVSLQPLAVLVSTNLHRFTVLPAWATLTQHCPSTVSRELTLQTRSSLQTLSQRYASLLVTQVFQSLGSSVGGILQRTAVALQFANCRDQRTDASRAARGQYMTVMENPTRLSFGDDEGAMYRGAAVGNVVLFAAVCVLATLTVVFSAYRQRHNNKSNDVINHGRWMETLARVMARHRRVWDCSLQKLKGRI